MSATAGNGRIAIKALSDTVTAMKAESNRSVALSCRTAGNVNTVHIQNTNTGSSAYGIYCIANGGQARAGHFENSATDGRGIQSTTNGSNGIAIRGTALNTGATGGIGGLFEGSKAPVILAPDSSSAAPTHTSSVGSLWVTSAGILYICTSVGTWQKVGAQ